jgi:hypothetical protein
MISNLGKFIDCLIIRAGRILAPLIPDHDRFHDWDYLVDEEASRDVWEPDELWRNVDG